jgi:hypothetical protein
MKDSVQEQENVPAAPDVKTSKVVGKKFLLIFQQNRSYELSVGGVKLVFAPHGHLPVDEATRNHPDVLAAEAQGFIRAQEV